MTSPGEAGMDPNVTFLLQQCAVLAGLISAPLFVIAAISRRRCSLLLVALACAGAVWLALTGWFVLNVDTSDRSSFSYQPLRIGPSTFQLWDTAWLVSVTLWAPTTIVYGLLRYLLARDRSQLDRRTVLACFLFYTLVGTVETWFWLFVSESYLGFTWSGWNWIQAGMSRAEVDGLLGSPIPTPWKPAFAHAQGAECYAGSATGRPATSRRFEHDGVERKHFWYSD
jgi:hypothetical protein